jgi:flagellar biosynthesis protein FliR
LNELIFLLTDIAEVLREEALAGLAVFLRVGALMLLLPAFAEQVVPMRVKLGLAISFTFIVAPAVQGDLPITDPFPFHLFATEIIAGLFLGFGIRLFVFALQIAGTIAAQATTLSQMFGGIGPEAQPIIGNVFMIAALAAAVSAGLHIRVAELLILSYHPFPAGQFPSSNEIAQASVDQIARAFSLAFSIAAPFLIASVLYNVAIGFINRAMPQLAVSFVGAPALTLGALGLLVLATPAILAIWLGLLNDYLANPMAVIP